MQKKTVEELAFENYSALDPWTHNDPWHDVVKETLDRSVTDWIARNVRDGDRVLIAGSGTTEYPISHAEAIYMDIIPRYVERFEHHIVGSVEDIPLETGSVQAIICVGSVLNYTDARKTIPEFGRILAPAGRLMLEYERSNSADFLLTGRHGGDMFQYPYAYNGQTHLLWMYGERYIDRLMGYAKLEPVSKQRYHILSPLMTRMGMEEGKAGAFAHFDTLLRRVSYPLAHNVIVDAVKLR